MMRQLSRVPTAPFFVVALTLLVGQTLTGCGPEFATNATAGARVTLTTAVTASAGARFKTGLGFDVTLTKAFIATGPFYYFEGPAFLAAARTRPSIPARIIEVLAPLKVAHAHPGHYVAGEARGQWLAPTSVNLLEGLTQLGSNDGVTGLVQSAQFSFSAPATGPYAGDLGGDVAVFEGTASRDGIERAFRASIRAADIAGGKPAPTIDGCPFDATTITTSGNVTVRIHLDQWFAHVAFDTVAPSSNSGRAEISPGTLAHNQLVRGMKVGTSYRFSFSR